MNNFIDDLNTYYEDQAPVTEAHSAIVYGLGTAVIGICIAIGFIIGRFVGKHDN
jgi:hypothetical protein